MNPQKRAADHDHRPVDTKTSHLGYDPRNAEGSEEALPVWRKERFARWPCGHAAGGDAGRPRTVTTGTPCTSATSSGPKTATRTGPPGVPLQQCVKKEARKKIYGRQTFRIVDTLEATAMVATTKRTGGQQAPVFTGDARSDYSECDSYVRGLHAWLMWPSML
jgi:hypothetical protein